MDDINKILQIPIEKLNLSVRSYFCLKNFNINTMDDLISYKTADLFKVRNLGLICYEEIINKVHELGLCFKDEIEEKKNLNLK